MKAGNAKAGFGPGSKKMGGPGKKPNPQMNPPKGPSGGAKAPTPKPPGMLGGMGAGPPPRTPVPDNDADDVGYRKGGSVKKR
jgi:hypothetical protein